MKNNILIFTKSIIYTISIILTLYISAIFIGLGMNTGGAKLWNIILGKSNIEIFIRGTAIFLLLLISQLRKAKIIFPIIFIALLLFFISVYIINKFSFVKSGCLIIYLIASVMLSLVINFFSIRKFKLKKYIQNDFIWVFLINLILLVFSLISFKQVV